MIINCPHCSGPLFKTKTEDLVSFSVDTKCPHCRKVVEIEFRREIVVILNGKKVDRLGEPKIRNLQ